MRGKKHLKPFVGKTLSLISLCTEITDCLHSSPNYIEKGKLVIRNFNIKNGNLNLSNPSFTDNKTFIQRTTRSKPEPGDLIITREAPMGEVCRIPDGIECCLGQRMVLIKPDAYKISSKFLLYALQSQFVQKQIDGSNKTGSIVSNLRIPVLKELRIPFFGENSNERIGEVLALIDKKIELNNRINQELEGMAKLLYNYWFVQFDFPISEEQARTMGKPELKGKPYKSSGGLMVYNEQLKRKVPEGWGSGSIGDIADLIRGVTYNKDDIKVQNVEDTIPILRATNITGNVVDLNDMVYVPTKLVNEKQLMNKFDVLLTMSSGSKDHIGKNGFFYFDKKVAFGAFCAKLVAKRHFTFFLYSYTQSEFMSATIKNECLGTNINNLNGSLVKGFKLVLPPEDLVKSFNKVVRPIFENIASNMQQNQELVNLRNWLLPMLMNGQVTVGEAKKEYENGREVLMAAEERGEYEK